MGPLVVAAQTGGSTVIPIETTAETVAPTIIGHGVDEPNNQIYTIWSEPIKPSSGTVIDGFTVFINNVQRPLVNGGGSIGYTPTEVVLTPLGIDIKPTDSIKISYKPGSNPIKSISNNSSGQTLSVTPVTNGLTGDTSCPTLQKQLLYINPTTNVFQGYFDERIQTTKTLFQEYSTKPTITVGATSIPESVTLSITNTVATKTLPNKYINWNDQLSITIDQSTTLQDLRGNTACPKTYTLAAPTEFIPIVTPVPTPTPPAKPGIPNTAQTIKTPVITSITITETAGTYTPGKYLTLTATTSEPLDATSSALVQLSSGNKRVLLKPTKDGSQTLSGRFITTTAMKSANPLRVSKILNIKLVPNDGTRQTLSDTALLLLDIKSPEYTKNIGDKDIFIK